MSESIDLMKLKRITADAECYYSVQPPFHFSKAELLGNAVTCTVSNIDGVKDWVGDHSIVMMREDMFKHDIIITYNGISFDYPLWGGCIYGGQDVRAKKNFEKMFKGKTVDLMKDFQEVLGVRVGLNDVSVPTLGDTKELDGGFAPDLWRAGQCLEVITYCRGDIRRTEELFKIAASGGTLKVKFKKTGEVREFKCMPKIR